MEPAHNGDPLRGRGAHLPPVRVGLRVRVRVRLRVRVRVRVRVRFRARDRLQFTARTD